MHNKSIERDAGLAAFLFQFDVFAPRPSCPALGRKRLYYLFDFGDNWKFEIRRHRKTKEAEAGVEYPRVVMTSGPNPEQYPSYE